jgi:Mn2+/Fe2+ NRAMP family transporter
MKPFRWLQAIGPGFVVAATGLGAGDLVAATVSGAKLGTAILWAVVLGALTKLVLNEGLVRWQLATDSSLMEGWREHLPRWVDWYFGVYLVLWSFLVGAALMAACGLAGHALFPVLSVGAWAAVHSLAALVLVMIGRYRFFEVVMKAMIALMFITVVGAVLVADLSGLAIVRPLLVPVFPRDNLALVLGVMGGIGGSVTLLCYGYWMHEKGWRSVNFLRLARVDLGVAYSLTAVFGVCIMILAARAQPETVSGTRIVLALAEQLGADLGEGFRWVFLLGFWGAVFSSMLGVWQGVPYLFADFVGQRQHLGPDGPEMDRKGPAYRGFLIGLAVLPLALLGFGKPVWLVILYSVAGAFFMPFLALTLLYLNNRRIGMPLRNGRFANGVLVVALALFAALAVQKLLE